MTDPWVFERSSGYAGMRNKQTGQWFYMKDYEKMTDPTDAELLMFMAKFCGLPALEWRCKHLWSTSDPTFPPEAVPDYLRSLDAWHKNVWPNVDRKLSTEWYRQLQMLLNDGREFSDITNADARSRCLALWRALEGELP